MKQGEIWQVYFDPVKGSEQAGNRPAVIISGNLMNHHSPILIVCPLSSSIHNFKGDPVLKPSELNGLKKKSELLVFQIRALSKTRFKKHIGKITAGELDQALNTLNDILLY